jgi:hypothetical protein
MTETVQVTEAGAAPEAVGAVLGRLMGDFAGTAGVILTELGLRLGLWDALAAGAATAETVAERSGTAVPYVREWLRSQAAAGYVGYDPAAGTFTLAPGVAAVLGEGPLSGLAGGVAAQFRVWWSELERYEDAFRTGRGISWGALPAAHAEGMDLISRAVVAPALVADWLPALDGVAARLAAGAAVADVGCGYGGPAIALAQAFPASAVTGFDVDDASVAQARKAARTGSGTPPRGGRRCPGGPPSSCSPAGSTTPPTWPPGPRTWPGSSATPTRCGSPTSSAGNWPASPAAAAATAAAGPAPCRRSRRGRPGGR